MTSAPAIAPQVAQRISKLILLLGSDQDNEALGAARALDRTLKAAGYSLHTVAAIVAAPPPPRAGRRADALLRMARTIALHEDCNTWEKRFAESVADLLARGCRLSKGQREKLHEVFDQVVGP